MKKTDKKRENALVVALTQACETAKEWESGFLWLTHTVDHSRFPDSLLVTCVFSLDAEVSQLVTQGTDNDFKDLIHKQLAKEGLCVPKIKSHLYFDSEERCAREDEGNWKKRLHMRSV